MPSVQSNCQRAAGVGGARTAGSGRPMPGMPQVVQVRASDSIRAGAPGVRPGEAEGRLTPHQRYMQWLDEAKRAERRGERLREAFARGVLFAMEEMYPQTCGRHRAQGNGRG